MAQSSALGGWLEASNRRNNLPGTSTGAPVSGMAPIGTGRRQVIAWNIRGALWIGTFVWWIYTGIAGSCLGQGASAVRLTNGV
jgi:hypothetical protein